MEKSQINTMAEISRQARNDKIDEYVSKVLFWSIFFPDFAGDFVAGTAGVVYYP